MPPYVFPQMFPHLIMIGQWSPEFVSVRIPEDSWKTNTSEPSRADLT
jgi:hypothetical protein